MTVAASAPPGAGRQAAMISALADADRETLGTLLKKLLDGLEAEEAEVQ